jgi:hypothetical protein
VIAAVAALLLLAAPPPGCAEALAARSLPPDALAERALELAARAAAGGPARGLEREAGELAAAGAGDRPALAARFAAALESHCRLRQEPRGRVRVAPGDREELERILSQPRFARARLDQGILGRWISQAWEWLLGLLGTGEAERYASGGRTAFFAAVAAAAVLLGARALSRRARRRRAPPPAEPEVEPPRPPAPAPEAALAGGDPTGAVRAAFLLALEALEHAGALPAGRALTNAEMARRLEAQASEAAADFTGLARAFDRAVYGGARPAPSEAASCVAAARRFAAAVAGRGP